MHAEDLDDAIAFYRDVLGACILARFDPPGLGFLDVGGVRILLEKDGPKAALYFWVDDIDAAYRELASKGVEFRGEPHLIHRDDAGTFGAVGAEEWMAFFSDPSGNLLALATRR